MHEHRHENILFPTQQIIALTQSGTKLPLQATNNTIHAHINPNEFNTQSFAPCLDRSASPDELSLRSAPYVGSTARAPCRTPRRCV